jgi:hypothetical protein
MADLKEALEHVEDFSKAVDLEDAVTLPASLSGLTDDEVRKLGKITTARLDLIVMPPLVIMYAD